jgi:hypothetical protein
MNSSVCVGFVCGCVCVCACECASVGVWRWVFLNVYIYLQHAPLQCNTTCSGDLAISIVTLTFSFMNIIFHSYLVCGTFGTVLSACGISLSFLN